MYNNKRKIVYVYQRYEGDKYAVIFSPKKINVKGIGFLGRMDDPFFRIDDVIEKFPEPRKRYFPKKTYKRNFVNKRQQ